MTAITNIYRSALLATCLVGGTACAEDKLAKEPLATPTQSTTAPAAPLSTAEPVSSALIDMELVKLVDMPLPSFSVDAAWPNMPEDQIIGQVPGLAIDKDDNVWIVQRPNSLTKFDNGAAQDPPIALCCKPAPHVIQFSPAGDILQAWGGEAHAPTIDGVNQWPASVQGIFVDDEMIVWIGGNGDGDHIVSGFSTSGEYKQSVGKRGATGGNADPSTLGNPADMTHDPETGHLLIADGYINKRVIGFNSKTDDFLTYWGAYGASPDGEAREGSFDQSMASSNNDGGANPDAEAFGDIVHCIEQSPTGDILVCDRRNNRIQLFRPDETGGYSFVKNIIIAPETGGTRTASDLAFSPDGAFMYVADMMNSVVWILDADSHEILGRFGRIGRYPGQFTWLHSVEVDSQGNLYTSEVGTGRRVQKFVFAGLQ